MALAIQAGDGRCWRQGACVDGTSEDAQSSISKPAVREGSQSAAEKGSLYATNPRQTLNSSVTPKASVAGTSTLVPMRSTPRTPPASSAVSAASSDKVRNVNAAM